MPDPEDVRKFFSQLPDIITDKLFALPQGELEAITEFAHVQKMQDAGSWMPVCSRLHKDHGLRT